MADAMMFTVDASQIVAKMHLAGLQATRGDVNNVSGFIVNTGITNDDPNGSPEKLGKTRFNLDNSSGAYYAGIVFNIEFYQLCALENAMTDIFKLIAELYGDKKLPDKNPSNAEELVKRFDAHVKTISDACQKVGIAVPSEDDFKDAAKLTKIRDELRAKANGNNSKISTYEDKVNEGKETAAKLLQSYMNVFAGADNVENITSDVVIAIQVSSKVKGPNDKALVNDFQIQPIPQSEKSALLASFKEKALKAKDDGKTPNCVIKMCFYVEYKLTIGE